MYEDCFMLFPHVLICLEIDFSEHNSISWKCLSLWKPIFRSDHKRIKWSGSDIQICDQLDLHLTLPKTTLSSTEKRERLNREENLNEQQWKKVKQSFQMTVMDTYIQLIQDRMTNRLL